ncbi:3,4-dihydroxy-2-butanone 4-phosphate synthase [Thermaerobacter marianensis DSM 12885]|uniref:Multifunctional fusion protein n=1 Tax=Thermaerobacter marianensis (strain ATCC 700841 / DSM 12885 / JCM 10246 / 7p75a) TaxID=644966 RepID=E6SMN7_THEM7|nr:bifunctional 3,4-dihydroxy-2-butanone-4-phosphate synthase/GTP cyclohydrolase II [Thermaerobacter marianensis]ADU51529.1 3,4-dihydroxy-2-butanone 4-phosphate synthase [Thermaerobacter marianensis DSM 12885]
MFTGIVAGTGRCLSVRRVPSGVELEVEASFLGDVHPGDSVAVNGVCLTVTAAADGRLTFTAVPETLRVTTLGDLRPGDAVNLEPALRWGQPVGGHLVQGHVDGTGTVRAVTRHGSEVRMEVEAPAALVPFLVPKGSVAVDGVSLTVVSVDGNRFTVALIPHTLQHTTLGRRRAGDRVNLEVDGLARYAIRWYAAAAGAGHGGPGAGDGWAGAAVHRPGPAGPRPSVGAASGADGAADPVERVQAALAALQAGRMVVVIDDADREGEGDLVVAAQHATPAHVNFMLQWGRGLICAAMAESRCQALHLPLMVDPPGDPMGTPFTVSVDARQGVTTGISAADRARTLRVLADPASRPADLVRPGHVFPLRARPWGVLQRRGHTEAAVDLVRMAGLQPVAAICEILGPDGEAAKPDTLTAWAAYHGLPWVRVSDIVAYRVQREPLVRQVAATRLPTPYGSFRLIAFEYLPTGEVHLALTYGVDATPGPSDRWEGPAPSEEPARGAVRSGGGGRGATEIPVDSPPASGEGKVAGQPVLVRVHSQCLTGDVFQSLRCDCGDQLRAAMAAIAREGRGVLVYLHQEGRSIGLVPKLQAYERQDQGLDTVEANLALGLPVDARDYAAAAQILRFLGIGAVRLLTNNPDKVEQLGRYGIRVAERVPLPPAWHRDNHRYLLAKRDRLGHWIDLPDMEAGEPAAPRPAGGTGGAPR